MRKLGLADWAAIAEIVGMVAVICSLLFVALSLERNTLAVSGQTADQIYNASREIDLLMLQDVELLELTVRGRDNPESLSSLERERYLHWVAMNLDLWEQMLARRSAGLVQAEIMRGWNEYFGDFVRRYVTPEMWADIRWWWTEDVGEIYTMVEAALAASETGRE